MPGLRKVGQENFHSKQLKLKSKTLQLRKEEEVENKKENKVGKEEERKGRKRKSQFFIYLRLCSLMVKA